MLKEILTVQTKGSSIKSIVRMKHLRGQWAEGTDKNFQMHEKTLRFAPSSFVCLQHVVLVIQILHH